MINVNMSVRNVLNVKENYVWYVAAFRSENGKHLTSIMDNSVIILDEVSQTAKLSQTAKKQKQFQQVYEKVQNFYIYLPFLLITKSLLIPVNIYSYLIKY